MEIRQYRVDENEAKEADDKNDIKPLHQIRGKKSQIGGTRHKKPT